MRGPDMRQCIYAACANAIMPEDSERTEVDRRFTSGFFRSMRISIDSRFRSRHKYNCATPVLEAYYGWRRKNQLLAAISNPQPGAPRVVDELFLAQAFFDPRDLVQVKYEMLRRVLIDGESVTAVSHAFGFSRTAYYQMLASFRHEGLPGLIPERPGPRGAHKLTEEIVEFLESQLAQDEALPVSALVKLLRQRFKLVVHPRSVERALARRKKGR